MLVLTRKQGEVVVIGGNIKIKVLSSEGKQIRLGIDAPKSIAVDREEVFDRKKSERKYPDI